MFAMGPKKRPAAKKVVKKATISKTAADVVTTKTRFNPRKFLEILLSRGSKKENGKVLQWASCCDGSNCPGYVLRTLGRFGMRSSHLFGILAASGRNGSREQHRQNVILMLVKAFRTELVCSTLAF